MATLANSTWRMTGCCRSQSMIVGCSMRPRTSIGTSAGTVLTKTNRPGPTRGGAVESTTTTSASPMPPAYWSGVFTSRATWGSVLRTFSRNRLPGLTSVTAILRGGGSTAHATLSLARSSLMCSRAATAPPPLWVNGSTTERRTLGSSVTDFSASERPSTSSEKSNVWASEV